MNSRSKLKLIIISLIAFSPSKPFSTTASSHLIQTFTEQCYQRDLHKAINSLQAMETHGLRADCLTYAELIKCCIARNAVKEGRIVAKHVCANGYERGLFLINNVMNMYEKFGMLGDAEKLFVEMPERNVVSWTTMISGYSKGEMGWKALGLFVLMGRDVLMGRLWDYSNWGDKFMCSSIIGASLVYAHLLCC